MRFYLSSCRFVIKPLDKLVLPEYKGVVLRGGLGTVFRDLVCINRDRDCGTCLISDTCAYFRIFETPVPKGAAMMRKYPYAPHPFAITPPLAPQTEFAPSDELSFELTLIGRATDALPHFIYAVEELGRRGLGSPENRFALVRVEDASGFAEGHCIYETGAGKLKDQLRQVDFSDLCDQARAAHSDGASPVVVLRFLTPTHIVTGGKIDHNLKFTSVMQSLLRRIKLLQYFHCLDNVPGSSQDDLPASRTGENPKPLSSGDNAEATCPSAHQEQISHPGSDGALTEEEISRLLSISDQAETGRRNLRWVGYPRKGGHTGSPMTLSGFVGEIEYSCPSEEAVMKLLLYLRLGQFIHTGKHTSFGYGRFEIMPQQQSWSVLFQ